MQSFRADLALLGLAVVGVLAELACVLTGHQAPGLFEQVTLAGLAGGAGVALPIRGGSADQVPPSAPAPVPPAAPVQASPGVPLYAVAPNAQGAR